MESITIEEKPIKRLNVDTFINKLLEYKNNKQK